MKYHSRKFIVTLICLVVAALFAWFNKLSPELSNVVVSCIASYNLANAWATSKDPND